jgi:hypothetical protein
MTNRIGLHVQTLGAVALVAQVLIAQGCSSSNPPSMTGAAGTTGSAGTVGSAGTTGAAGTSGAAGAVGSAGAAGTAGATGAGGYGSPACPTNTVAGVALAKGAACAAADPQLCYKTCGPEKAGVKSETCASSALYTEGSCMFDPSVSYSCYKIPAAANTACPLDADAGTGTYLTPQGSQACTISDCMPCNSLGGVAGGFYKDSTGASKTGYCVCQPPNANGNQVWSCSSDTAWPCPSGSGC